MVLKDPDKVFPSVGQKLVHRFRKKEFEDKEVVAEVVAVDEEKGTVVVRVGSKVYPSLSTAANSITGGATNGWIFWGLKKNAFTKKKA